MGFRKKLSSRRIVYVIYQLSVIVSDSRYVIILIVFVVCRKIKILCLCKISIVIIIILRYAIIGAVGNANIIEVGGAVKIIRKLANNVDISNPDTR